MKKLYVGNLSYQTTSDQLQALFANIGEVEEVAVIEDRDTGRSKGFAFVSMTNDSEAQQAIQELDGKDLDGRNIKVSEARPRAPRDDRRNSRW
jgi:RNA recognition motif-containing protein